MKFVRQTSGDSAEENIFWASMSDLLLGLLIVFIVLFALAMMGMNKQKVTQENVKSQIVEKLNSEFKKKNISVEIEPYSGNMKISDLELFNLGDHKISPRGKAYLNKVIPIYLNTLLGDPEVKKQISRIIIEGHTDSHKYVGSKNKYDNYNKNLDLSLRRAMAVTQHIVNLEFPGKKNYKNDLIDMLSTNGRSFSEPVINEYGKEDFKKSRRVELKFQLKDFNFIDLIKKYNYQKREEFDRES